MKVSIVIPMKNEESNIVQCLRAILDNSFNEKYYEIICVDNGSTDQTVELAKKLVKNVFLLPDKTISCLRNYGAQKAQGEYLAFVDVDCVVDKYWLMAASIYFNSQEVVCFGSTPEIPYNSSWVQKAWYINKGKRREVQQVEWLESMNLFVKKDVFCSFGGFNENLETCEDVDLCYRIGEKYKIISDKRIKSIHSGEAKTLLEFFKKEMWRGRSNIVGLKEHGLKLKELPSIVLPLYYLSIPVIFFVMLFFINFSIAALSCVILLISPPLLVSICLSFKISKYNYILKTTVVYFVYFLARAFAILR